MSCQTHNESLGWGQRPVSLGNISEQGWGQGVWGQVLDPWSVPQLGRGGVTCRTKCSTYVCQVRGTEQSPTPTSGARDGCI